MKMLGVLAIAIFYSQLSLAKTEVIDVLLANSFKPVAGSTESEPEKKCNLALYEPGLYLEDVYSNSYWFVFWIEGTMRIDILFPDSRWSIDEAKSIITFNDPELELRIGFDPTTFQFTNAYSKDSGFGQTFEYTCVAK